MARPIRAMTDDFRDTFGAGLVGLGLRLVGQKKTTERARLSGFEMTHSDVVFHRLLRQERRQGRSFARALAAGTIDGAARYLDR